MKNEMNKVVVNSLTIFGKEIKNNHIAIGLGTVVAGIIIGGVIMMMNNKKESEGEMLDLKTALDDVKAKIEAVKAGKTDLTDVGTVKGFKVVEPKTEKEESSEETK